ncbi:hypothetical protein [Clostridium sp.]|uniref:hypothetical protein n=1 Tax=Clostridium sp. TaxID=1506 RepID=UPI0032175421
MIKVKTGQSWLKTIGKKAFYSPELKEGKYYMLKTYSRSRDFSAEIYTFEEVEIYD